LKQNQNQDSCKSKCNKSHLTLYQRQQLLECIKQGLNQKDTANVLGVNKTTVSRELFSHRTLAVNHKKAANRCAHLSECSIKHICTDMKCVSKCKNCQYGKRCDRICENYELVKCKRTQRFPYVCNGCPKTRSCIMDYYWYDPQNADKEAKSVLVNSRRGIDMSEQEFAEMDRILLEGTKKGQSVEHIVEANNLSVSPRTIRNYISLGLTTIKSYETPRGASYKPRKKQYSKEEMAKRRVAKTGRDLAAFLNYANSLSFFLYTQIDTVEGTKRDEDKSRLLTFIFVRVRLFYSVSIPNGTQKSIKAAMDTLYKKLGHDDFTFAFGVLLTDNGVEFSDPLAIECDSSTGELRSRLFFCNPYSSWEKGAIEVCHELLRRIVPKGSSLKNISQNDADQINSHINSYIRGSNGQKNAYDTFVDAFGDRALRILKKLNITRIEPKDVILHPSLIKKE